MAPVVPQFLLFFLLIQVVIASTGPPAARPPDFETLQKSFGQEDGKATEAMRRVIISKATTEGVKEATPVGSDFADEDFSSEMKDEKTVTTEEATTVEATTDEPTTKTTTTEAPTTTVKSTTLKKLEIKKIVRPTTPLPPPEDRLSPIEELRLLKKLSSKGIAFGVRNKELELIHNTEGELELPPFAFSEDENSVTEEDSFVTEVVTPPATSSTSSPTTKSTKKIITTTDEPTTKATTELTTTVKQVTKSTTTFRPSTTAVPAMADIEVLEKELSRFREEPFKLGTNIVPLHLFFEQSMGVHKRRKLALAKKLSGEATATPRPTTGTTRVPAMMQAFASTGAPRTDDFLIPQAEDKAHDEKMLDSFKFPMLANVDTTNGPPIKAKMPEKTILPSLLEMPHLSSLSSFGSLAVPIHPSGLSQRIRHIRLDSEAEPLVSSKSKVSGKMSRKRRRLMKRKQAHAAPNTFLHGLTVPLAIKIKKIEIPDQKEPKEAIKGTAKIVKTDNVKAEEERFAKSLAEKADKESTTALIVDSLKKMKKVTRLLLKKKNRKERARVNSGGKTVQVVARSQSHDGEARAVKVDGNTDDREAVVDRDFARKTVDRDV